MREFARFLVIEGKAREFEGRYADALDVYMIILRIGDHVAQDPHLISGLVGIACNAIGARAIEQCILRHDLDDETLARAQKRALELSKGRPNCLHAMRGERALSTQTLEFLIKRPSQLWAMEGGKPKFKELMWALSVSYTHLTLPTN